MGFRDGSWVWEVCWVQTSNPHRPQQVFSYDCKMPGTDASPCRPHWGSWMTVGHWVQTQNPYRPPRGFQTTVFSWMQTPRSPWPSAMGPRCGWVPGHRLPVLTGLIEGSWMTAGDWAQTAGFCRPQRWFPGVGRLLGADSQCPQASPRIPG